MSFFYLVERYPACISGNGLAPEVQRVTHELLSCAPEVLLSFGMKLMRNPKTLFRECMERFISCVDSFIYW